MSTELDKILLKLKKTFGINLDLKGASLTELHDINSHYKRVQQNILLEQSFNSYHSHPEFTKAVLICEAIKLFLSEVAPARKKGKVKPKVKESKLDEYGKLASHTAMAADPRFTNHSKLDVISQAIKELCAKGAHKLSDVKKWAMVSDIADEYDLDQRDLLAFFDKSGVCQTVESVTEEIEPEVEMSDDMGDAGQTFDGEDLSDDYTDDRKPNGDHGFDDYDYTEMQDWVDNDFLLQPETGTGNPGPNPNDYADDRNVVKISKDDKGPGYKKTDVFDQLKQVTAKHPYDETILGLDDELESNLTRKDKPSTKNGVRSEDFNNDPRKSEQRDIPSPTDLQTGNKKMYNEAIKQKRLAFKLIDRLNSTIMIDEALEQVACQTGTTVKDVRLAYEKYGKRHILEHAVRDKPYQLGLMTAYDLMHGVEYKRMVVESSQDLDTFLLNKATVYGLSDKQVRQYVYAALTVLARNKVV
jgi:hypothetical protein